MLVVPRDTGTCLAKLNGSVWAVMPRLRVIKVERARRFASSRHRQDRVSSRLCLCVLLRPAAIERWFSALHLMGQLNHVFVTQWLRLYRWHTFKCNRQAGEGGLLNNGSARHL